MYKVVRQQDWTIHTPDNQPARGFLVTVADPITGDSFSIETPSMDAAVVADKVQAHLDQRRQTANLTFD